MNLRIRKTSLRELEATAFERAFDVVVLYTSAAMAEAALKRAEELADGMKVHIRLVCTQIIPCPLPMDQPPINLLHLEQELERVSVQSGLDVEGEIVLARDMQTALKSTLRSHSNVVIASSRRLWRTREESLQEACVKAGHA